MDTHPEWKRAYTHEAMEPIYNATLHPDLAFFRARVRLASGLGLANQLKKYHANSTRVRKGTAVVVVRGGKVMGLTFSDFNPAFKLRVDSVVSELQRHQDAGHIALEDTILILNCRDVPLCSLGYCMVPIFSPVKEVRRGKAYNEDLLVPLMAYPHEQLVYVEQKDKLNMGVIASYRDQSMGGDGGCRSFVHKFARDKEGQGSKYLQVLSANRLRRQQLEEAAGKAEAEAKSSSSSDKKEGDDDGAEGAEGSVVEEGEGGAVDSMGVQVVSGIAPVPPPAAPLARYWFTFSCDAQTANPALASLLHLNSVVLKGRSNWAEYYYRALQEDVHYQELDPGFALDVVRSQLEAGNTTRLAAIAEAGQRFAYTYLSQRSRALFWEKAISEYNTLFGEGYMKATVADLPSSRPLAMEDILKLPMYPSTWRQGLA
ncbi:hypothetical protein HYH03_005620 [Edaphochlamys debaryana]|uniref:Glycosyl transferase CAP10 domain-containing protein n=1 Tax=Edaphochlamys debaryana TaxID=47281 RepID=A0A836C278_9CHLO|nr:hypothetical protein HYH03_005620 [Edaphochlamys debaryana]|eukprot:KAG2496393.1 hypothetical protein HYH03_005620 [Edaphochlamys debaryana]